MMMMKTDSGETYHQSDKEVERCKLLVSDEL